jgi:hypothetical protein
VSGTPGSREQRTIARITWDPIGPEGIRRKTAMPDQRADGPPDREKRQEEYSFVPDLAWAIAGGVVVLVTCVLLFTLIVTWGGLRVGPPMPGGGVAPLSAYSSQLAGFFLGGFLVVFIARVVSART